MLGLSEEFPKPFGGYELVEQLATGGMAEIYLANRLGVQGFKKRVVIKLLLPHMAADPRFTQMFVDEARLTARLVHPKIAQTHELGLFEGRLFMCMEWINGIDVLSMLRECAHRRLKLPLEVSAFIMCEVLDALEFAHNCTNEEGTALDIVHRDVSPSNVLLSLRGDVKLIDFGIARALGNAHQTQSGVLKGKYGYMSPEQVIGDPLDSRSDLFSAGVVLAELLMGRRLFAAPNELDVLLMVRDAKLDRLDRFGAHIPEDMRELVGQALRKDRNARFPSAAAFRNALSDWMFVNQHRVSSRGIADIVRVLYDDVANRRRGLDHAAKDDSSHAGFTPVDDALAEQELAQKSAVGGAAPEIQGVPSGTLKGTDSLPIISIEPSREVAVPQQAADVAEEATDKRRANTNELAEIDAAVESLGADSEEDDDDGDGTIQIPIDDLLSEAVDAVRVEDSGHETSGHRDSDELRNVPQQMNDAEQELSVRHSSIEEAITSVAVQEPDPSANDFDELPVKAAPVGRSNRMRLPTVDEIHRSPPPKPPSFPEIEGTPGQHGDLATKPPIRIMYELWADQAQGLLVVSVGAVRKEIYLKDGTPEFVSSNLAKELFGEFLVREKALSQGELAMALAMMPHYGGRLGDTLVGLGLMKPLEVFRMLHNQVRAKLVDVCTWEKGTYAYYADRDNPREAFPLDLHVPDVVGRGAMAVTAGYLGEWVKRNSRARPRSLSNRNLKPTEFSLGAEVRNLYDSLSGGKTLAELCERFDDEASKLQFMRALFLLVQTDLASLAAE